MDIFLMTASLALAGIIAGAPDDGLRALIASQVHDLVALATDATRDAGELAAGAASAPHG